MHAMNTPNDSSLGRAASYPRHYDASVLFPIPRAQGRAALGLGDELPFHGVDIWNAYELSWLDHSGKPRIALARFWIPATSPNLIESKSFKLYLGSFAGTRMDDAEQVRAWLERDLSQAAGAAVTVRLDDAAHGTRECIETLAGTCIDGVAVNIDYYGPPTPAFLHADPNAIVDEVLVSHLLKSNCPVTGQPDWASVQIAYRGPRIGPAGLLRYLVSFREHSGFHEQCVEQIHCDLMARCAPHSLTVYARYTRRGGLDINPWRSSTPGTPSNPRLPRQ